MIQNIFRVVFVISVVSCFTLEGCSISNMSLLNKENFQDVISALNLKVSPEGELSIPEDGRIASNAIITTDTGKVLVRSYDTSDQKLETGDCEFEVLALKFLSNLGCNVPIPVPFKTSEFIKTYGTVKVFAYKMIPGDRVKLRDLTKDNISEIGDFLNRLISCTSSFVPERTLNIPSGDQEHIRKIFDITCERCKELTKDKWFSSMLDMCKDKKITEQLEKTPYGIVHADFFDENIVFDGYKYGLIDFGDAYYGAVINDIVIGAMEFSVIDEQWNLEFLENFLKPLSGWLLKSNVGNELFMQLLRLNCIRFLCYTLRFSSYQDYDSNPYYIRYKNLTTNSKLEKDVRSVFEKVCEE